MANVDVSADAAAKAAGFAAIQQAADSGVSHRDLPLFRFGLRQLLGAIAAISVLFAALASVQGLVALVTLLAAIVVVMHVFATSLGHRLRARSDRDHSFESAEHLPIGSIATPAERSRRMALLQSVPRSPWHARGTTVLPWLRALVLAAIACGAVVGAAYLAVTIGYRTSPAGVVVGGLSVAVLWGWFAFLVGSFYGVFRHGFREAASDRNDDWR